MVHGFRYALQLESVRKLLSNNFQSIKCLKCDTRSAWYIFQNLDENGIPFNDEGVEEMGLCLDHFESLYNEQYEKYKNVIGSN